MGRMLPWESCRHSHVRGPHYTGTLNRYYSTLPSCCNSDGAIKTHVQHSQRSIKSNKGQERHMVGRPCRSSWIAHDGVPGPKLPHSRLQAPRERFPNTKTDQGQQHVILLLAFSALEEGNVPQQLALTARLWVGQQQLDVLCCLALSGVSVQHVDALPVAAVWHARTRGES
eukprot:365920-Chlamydomonas_euryale.AAC.15